MLFSILRTSTPHPLAQAAGDPALQAPGNPVVQALCDLAPGDPNFQAPGDTTSIAPVANGNPARANTALVNNTSHVPTTDMVDSEGTAALFWDGIFRLHGLPSSLGATFTSEFSRSLCCRLSGITHGFPSANGRPDRA
jgi:hypothetical protein